MILLQPLTVVNITVVNKPIIYVLNNTTFEKQMLQDIENTFINPNEFAIQVIYTHATGEIKVYNAIKDNPYESIGFEDHTISSNVLTLQIAAHLMLRAPRNGDTLRIKGANYKYRNHEPDGVGIYEISVFKD